VEPEETSIAGQEPSKQVFAATNTRATIEESLGIIVSVQSAQSGYKRREPVNWSTVGRLAVKRRL
jgi:hypothetical protein